MQFDWDPDKERINKRKHGISFWDAVSVFDSSLTRHAADIEHGEPRIVATGPSTVGLLHVIYVERGHLIRIISARKATRKERKGYECSR
ncbi:BrnT family toxin [Massilia sp. SM-13]|uniref:BrnT family toxin n=1 Tax=Pseudoduganella rhizocola TaxID=3382643 RepID=UPI0038B42927